LLYPCKGGDKIALIAVFSPLPTQYFHFKALHANRRAKALKERIASRHYREKKAVGEVKMNEYKDWILHNIEKTQDEIRQLNTKNRRIDILINRFIKLHELLDNQ
jgi:hypothetical protein